MSNILILANARIAGGISGGDNIYVNLIGYWRDQGHTVTVQELMHVDYKPFWLCYLHKILAGCYSSLGRGKKYDLIYSASDFLMDSIPAFIHKLRGSKWVAGYYLHAPKDRKIYYYTQQIAYFFIKRYADVVCLTNMNDAWAFPDKPLVDIKGGGVDLSLAGLSEQPKEYDAVFIGRLHPTKGIKEMVDIWAKVREGNPKALLAVIGDGDLGMNYISKRVSQLSDGDLGIKLMGYMGEERYEVYKRSKVVLYPAPYDHSGMSPVEAMACGCPMVSFDLAVWKHFDVKGACFASSIDEYAEKVLSLISSCDEDDSYYLDKSLRAYGWAKEWDWKKRTKDIGLQIKNQLADRI